MSKHFYRDIKIVKFCKKSGCGVEFRPQRGKRTEGLCIKHRREFYKTHFKAWLKAISVEQKATFNKKGYERWLKWVEQHKDRRRALALASYHRRKKLKS